MSPLNSPICIYFHTCSLWLQPLLLLTGAFKIQPARIPVSIIASFFTTFEENLLPRIVEWPGDTILDEITIDKGYTCEMDQLYPENIHSDMVKYYYWNSFCSCAIQPVWSKFVEAVLEFCFLHICSSYTPAPNLQSNIENKSKSVNSIVANAHYSSSWLFFDNMW
jgi:hypothetical protein